MDGHVLYASQSGRGLLTVLKAKRVFHKQDKYLRHCKKKTKKNINDGALTDSRSLGQADTQLAAIVII